MDKISEFPFKNYLDHKIDTVTDEMVWAVIQAQKNHHTFNKIALLARQIFLHRWSRGELLYTDMIKVFVGLGNDEYLHFNIDESSRLPEHVAAVPLGYLSVVHELCDVSIPCSANLDCASLHAETARGLGYEWIHTDAAELLTEVYLVWKQVISRGDLYDDVTQDYENFVDNTNEYTAKLCETALISLRAKQIKDQRKSLILTALHTLKDYSENHLGICEIFVKEAPNTSAEDYASDYQEFGVLDLFNWICENLYYPKLYGTYEDFVEHLQNLLSDESFEKDFPDAHSKLISVFIRSGVSYG